MKYNDLKNNRHLLYHSVCRSQYTINISTNTVFFFLFFFFLLQWVLSYIGLIGDLLLSLPTQFLENILSHGGSVWSEALTFPGHQTSIEHLKASQVIPSEQASRMAREINSKRESASKIELMVFLILSYFITLPVFFLLEAGSQTQPVLKWRGLYKDLINTKMWNHWDPSYKLPTKMIVIVTVPIIIIVNTEK